ncbi:MAG TPA: hypothetical protein DD670_01290 [Planctomycetaceae bacterium]|nr:hypothetical protein [Planctomycetaceae bacterium]
MKRNPFKQASGSNGGAVREIVNAILVAVFLVATIGAFASRASAADAIPKPDLDSLPVVDSSLVPMRAVTRGPKFHWFGYYNKDQIDSTGRYLLAMQVDFEHRSPTADDKVTIGMVDLEDGDRWIELAESRAWNWQQGCMVQWRPGSATEVLFNDRDGDQFVCRVLDVKTGKTRTLPMPIEHVTADGKRAVCSDYRRIQYIRPGYGYAGLPDPNRDILALNDVGAWVMDMETGETRLVVSIAQLVAIPYSNATSKDKHYLNHFEWNADGTRFLMFNRWVGGVPGQPTRVFTAADTRPQGKDGQAIHGTRDTGQANRDSDVRLLSKWGASHWVWRDAEHVLFWGLGGYKLYKDDGSGQPKETLWIAPNGHESYIPGTENQWLVTDTYPRGPRREQTLYLFHLPTSRVVVLGRFASPKEYSGEWRCDLHPRATRDGKHIVIDSPHGGDGRQQYLFDIGRLVGEGRNGD